MKSEFPNQFQSQMDSRMKARFRTNLICIPGGSTMREARTLMNERRIRHLPVLNAENEIVGILSRHDLTDLEQVQDYPVEMLARSPVTYVTIDTPLRTVALKMIEEKISSVLLTDQHQNAIGIITTDDLLYQLATMLKNDRDEPVRPWTESDSLITVGEFFRRLSDIGI